jgi:energy-coupling factor transporter ATP-binding protein EcfA2
MITSLEHRNFKAHRETTLPLGQLTVLVGPNSAGKTSVLQALAVLGASVGEDPWVSLSRLERHVPGAGRDPPGQHDGEGCRSILAAGCMRSASRTKGSRHLSANLPNTSSVLAPRNPKRVLATLAEGDREQAGLLGAEFKPGGGRLIRVAHRHLLSAQHGSREVGRPSVPPKEHEVEPGRTWRFNHCLKTTDHDRRGRSVLTSVGGSVLDSGEARRCGK